MFKKKSRKKKLKWSDITLAAHQRILNAYATTEDDDLLTYNLVTAVYGWEEGKIEKMTIAEANEWVDTIMFLAEKPKPVTAKSHYILNGKRYNTTMNLTKVSTAQYIDFQQMADKSGEMPAEFLSIILIPNGCDYNEGYEISDVVEDIRNYLTVGEALGLTAFFFDLLRISIRKSTARLKKLTKKAEKEGKMSGEQLEALRGLQRLLTECESGMRQLMP